MTQRHGALAPIFRPGEDRGAMYFPLNPPGLVFVAVAAPIMAQMRGIYELRGAA